MDDADLVVAIAAEIRKRLTLISESWALVAARAAVDVMRENDCR